jgi:predicted nucleic acid-binding protein
MAALIDSSVLIQAERTRIGLDELLSAHGEEEIAIATITASDLLHGVHRARTPAQRAKREAFVESILSVVPVVPFDLVAARVHAGLWAELAARGVTIGAHDLLIAATALAIGFELATHDRRSFPKIPGLHVLDW